MRNIFCHVCVLIAIGLHQKVKNDYMNSNVWKVDSYFSFLFLKKLTVYNQNFLLYFYYIMVSLRNTYLTHTFVWFKKKQEKKPDVICYFWLKIIVFNSNLLLRFLFGWHFFLIWHFALFFSYLFSIFSNIF